MSTADRIAPTLPPLVDGQRLDRATFHERYGAMPDHTRAELIGGVVYMAIPHLGVEHGDSGISVSYWLAHYRSYTPGVQALENASVFFDDYGEPQPDALLRILPSHGGRTRAEGRFLAEGPELVAEVSDTTLRRDLGPKKSDYERAGVLEYVVVSLSPAAVRWHARRDGRLVEVPPLEDGLFRSETFPGLWLDPVALLSGDLRTIRETVDRGVATPEHAEFVGRLARAAEERRQG